MAMAPLQRVMSAPIIRLAAISGFPLFNDVTAQPFCGLLAAPFLDVPQYSS